MERGTTNSDDGVQIRLLGGVGATDPDGSPIDIGPAKCQALLAALALSPGSAIPVTRLVDLVWGEDPPRTAEKTLQTYVTQLRQRLGAEAIARVGAAYRLDIGPELVDAVRFQRCLDEGDVGGALADWTGPPLAGLDAPGLDATIAGLVEQWLTAVETDLERLTATDPAGAVGPLTELTADHPFREGLGARRMTALYASGRQAEALAAYRRARRHLVDELGVEPGPRLRELEASILDQDERLPSQPRSSRPATLPSGTVTFAFSDVEGSTQLWAADRTRASAAIARHEEIVRAAAADHSGQVFATGGDSFGVAFHRASDALDCATALQAAITAEPWPSGCEVRLRIGLHTGEAEERADSYFGAAVNLTARVAAAGHGGQTLLSGVTAALVAERGLVDLGPIRLDGVEGDQPVFQLGADEHPPLRAEGRRRGNLPRSPGPLFGRADLLADVVDALGSAPVVTLVGPGGIGKTRLALDAARLAGADSPGGAWLVELADIASSGEVARAVADALDVTALPGRPLAAAIAMSLDARRAMLVLDNCEHVVDGAAALASAVADGSDHARVL
ncbi:MAG: BTAD domain-containing putative transcriptional regulator, partial [Ilumatobacteraceae bacterium]